MNTHDDNMIKQSKIINDDEFFIEFYEPKNSEFTLIVENGEFSLKKILASFVSQKMLNISINIEKLKIET